MRNKILLIGMPGCGKTTLGRELAKNISCNFVDMDGFIEETSKKTIKELFAYGEESFRDVESQCCELLSNLDNVVVSSGGGVVKRKKNMDCFSKFTIIFINRPLELIMDDLDTESRPLLSAGKEKMFSLYRERIELYNTYKNFEVINDGALSDVGKKLIEIVKLK